MKCVAGVGTGTDNEGSMIAEVTSATFRAAAEEDLEALVALAAELGYSIEISEAGQRIREIRSDRRQLFPAAVLQGQVVGWAHAGIHEQFLMDKHADLYGLVVGSCWRGRGIGREILSKVEKWACVHECVFILVRSNVVRERAHGFYRGLGYDEKKRQAILVKELS